MKRLSCYGKVKISLLHDYIISLQTETTQLSSRLKNITPPLVRSEELAFGGDRHCIAASAEIEKSEEGNVRLSAF